MRSLLFVVVLTAFFVVCAGVPARDIQHNRLERIRRSINPFIFFNTKKDTKKKTKETTKTKLKPKPTTKATTTQPLITSTTQIDISTVQNKMPEHIAEKMGKLTTNAEVEKFLRISPSMKQRIELGKNTLPGMNVSGQSSGSLGLEAWTKSTECIPRPQPIRHAQHALHYGVTWPFCTMALRCGGCCHVDLHHCVPDQVSYVPHKVYFIPYDIRNDNDVQERNMPVENHRSCKCECKLTPRHCNPERQYHKKSTCQCLCKDAFTKSNMNCSDPFIYDKDTCSCKCKYQHKYCPAINQIWDANKCTCTCDSRIHCSKGKILDSSCKCVNIKMSAMDKN